MAWIEKREGPRGVRWIVAWRENGRIRRESWRTHADAKRRRAQVEHELASPQPARRAWTVEAWCEQWLTTLDVSESTRALAEVSVRRHITPAFGALLLGDLTADHVREWSMRTAGAPASRAKRASHLRQALSAAVAAGHVPVNVAALVDKPRVPRKDMTILTPAEVRRLADEVGAYGDGRYRALVFVAAFGGLRFGELAGLRRHRVDLERRRLQVVEQIVPVRGVLVAQQPKTRAGTRTIGLAGVVATELRRHIDAFGVRGDGLVFAGTDGGALRNTAFRRRVWLPAVERAGVAGLHVHDLRHTAASTMIAAGADIKQLQRFMGHASAAMTLDRYGWLYPEGADALAAKLDAFIGSA